MRRRCACLLKHREKVQVAGRDSEGEKKAMGMVGGQSNAEERF